MTTSKTRMLENTRRWRKTKRGLVTNIFHKMKSRHSTSISLDDLHAFAESKQFNRLYSEWASSGYQLQRRPTIDRISSKRGYDQDNIHWLSWAENRFKESLDRRHNGRKVAQIADDRIIRVFRSQKEAVQETGFAQSTLSSALNGERQSYGGYVWKYFDSRIDLLPSAS